MSDQIKHRGACLVCGHPQGSAHFGSTSCLACAAFFRRTVSLDINFKCKNKRNDCRVFHELRMVCRACRFARCLSAGLQTAMVQKRRVMKRKSEVKMEDDFGDDTAEQSPPEVHTDSPAQSFMSSIPESPNFPASISSLLSPKPKPMMTLENLDGATLLSHYVSEHRRTMDRRYLMFSDRPIGVIALDYTEMPFSVKDRKPHSMKRQSESQKLDHLLAFDYCLATPGYNEMTAEEKLAFFRMATLSFCLLDIAWITCQAVEQKDNMMMYTDGSLSSVDDFTFGWDDEEGLPTGEKEKLFGPFVQRMYHGLVVPLMMLKIDEVEYAALKALCIWKMGYMEYSQDVREIGKKHENALLEGLEAHYDDREDKDTRLGNLLLTMGTVFELYRDVLEMYHGISLFDLLKIDSVSMQLLQFT